MSRLLPPPPSFLRALGAVLCGGVFLLALPSAVAASAAQEPPDIPRLVQAAIETDKKLATKAASWRMRFLLPNGAAVETQVVREGKRRAWTFYFVHQGRSEALSRVVETDGIWHVHEGKRFAKYRPYEADLGVPLAYLFLVMAEPRGVKAGDLDRGRFEGREGKAAVFRVPLPEGNRAALAKAVAGLDEQMKKDPKKAEDPAMRQMIATARESLAKGVPAKVDESSGLLVEMKLGDKVLTLLDFTWIEQTSEADFGLPTGAAWDDQTKPWSASELEECAMVGHSRLYQAGAPTPELDAFLLHLPSGRLRRVPYLGASSTVGCFLPGRREVIVSGFDASGTIGFVRVNLETGENTSLEPDLRPGQVSLLAELSPDGKRVATIQGPQAGPGMALDLQLRIMNLADRRSKLLGKPSRIGAPFSWLPDGSGLVAKRFEPKPDAQGIEPRFICRIGLDGKMTDLRPGEWPIVLRKSGRILYQEQSTRRWHTCALDGSNPELYADGLVGHGSPAVSPDEKQIVFVRYEKGRVPELRVFEFGKAEGRPAVQDPGLTLSPAWR